VQSSIIYYKDNLAGNGAVEVIRFHRVPAISGKIQLSPVKE